MKNLLIFLCLCTGITTAFAQCIKGDCINGEGTMVYSNGGKYVGSFKDGKIEGKGMLIFGNGDKYIGEWQNQQRQGKGRLTFTNGDLYFGDFEKNNLQGTGRMQFANGDVYEGQWLNGKPNGTGKYVFSEGNVYEGEIKDGFLEGIGTMRYKDGATYNGNWKGSLRNGKGVFVTSHGDIVEDEWIDDRLAKEVFSSDGATGDAEMFPFPEIDRSPETKVWAVVVGIASYDHMPSLRYTDDDAYKFFAFLRGPEGGALPEKQIRVLIDEEATSRTIIYTMKRIFLQADENDVVLFYFSGHGFEDSFVPADYDGVKNLLKHDEVRQIIENSKAKHKIIIADACHSGGYVSSDANGEENRDFAIKSLDAIVQKYYRAFENSSGGISIVLSSGVKEYSLEDGGLRSGVFSYFVIKGMRGEADSNNDKLVTIQELHDYARKNVRHYTANMQTPVLKGKFDPNTPISVVRY
jgi:hypothetical protein